MRTDFQTCPADDTRIIWAVRTDQPGRKVRLNWQPDPQGTYASYQGASGGWHARHLAPGEQPYAHEKRRAAHHTTCTATEGDEE